MTPSVKISWGSKIKYFQGSTSIWSTGSTHTGFSTRESNRFKEFSRQLQVSLQSPVNKETITTESTAPSVPTESTELTLRTSSKQRKASLDEYRELFLKAPKITDRQPVFVSRATRDSIDDIVRRLGERKMSVSGFLENLANHHLETYREEVEQWKRL